MVRTTLTIADDVYELARLLAERERISIGEALSRLVRRGLNPAPPPPSSRSDFPVFHVPLGAERITLARTLDVEDQE
jgi:hypothetical protein